jgi:formylglycine-generating enzyme
MNQPQIENIRSETPSTRPDDMVWISGGTFRMGSDRFYPEERPIHDETVDGFWMNIGPVTNAEFEAFVDATGYVTVAERTPDPADYPGIDPDLLIPGSLVFRRPMRRIGGQDPNAWWVYLAGACWKRPEGPGSSIRGREQHPAVHVAYEDAEAYAAWAGKAIPSEAEWEFAARGGLDGADFAWGNEPLPEGRHLANTWQGEFPWQNLAIDGFEGRSPVGAFPANGYGLLDMIGNVWEWTRDAYHVRHAHSAASPCCAPGNPMQELTDPCLASAGSRGAIPRKVVKGGSHLCAPNYCLRYRPSARQGEDIDTSTSHIGFRCVMRPLAESAAPDR